jgi:Fe-coproporphyrin III synthase
MSISYDVLKKAMHAARHPGVSDGASLPVLAWKGLPYLLSPSGRARAPISIYWNVNSVCNLRCKMCDVGTFNEESNFFKNLRIDRKLHEIALERFCSVIDEVKDSRPMITINGTEPLMYEPLGAAIDYARKADLLVTVTTGGYDLPKRAQELADAGLTRLNVSIDAAPELHNKIRGRKDAFLRATEGLVAFKEATKAKGYEAQVYICGTVMSMNYDQLEEFYDAVSDLPADSINLTNMNFVSGDMAKEHNATWGRKYRATVNCVSDDVAPDMVDVDVLHEQLQRVKAKGGDRVNLMPDFSRDELHRYYHRPMEFMGSVPCMSTWYVAQVMADGEIIPYTRCYHVPLGNINEESFSDIWNGERARSWRQDLKRNGRFPACTRCDMVY